MFFRHVGCKSCLVAKCRSILRRQAGLVNLTGADLDSGRLSQNSRTASKIRIEILFDPIQIRIRAALTQDQFFRPAVAVGLKDDLHIRALKHIITSGLRQ
jgi:hypothetical protein